MGVTQYPSDTSTTRAYSVIGQTLTFVSAPDDGVAIQARHIGFAGATTSEVTGFYGRTGNVALKSTDDITFQNASAGIITATTFGGNPSFTGSVSIGGTLTYEDVTNIDSVGIITARSDIKVGTAVTLTSAGAGFYAGIITASDFVKRDGTSLGGGGLESDAQLNTVAGTNAGQNLTVNAVHNTLIGYVAGNQINAADNCVFIGSGAGAGVVNSGSSIAIGKNALSGTNAGEENTAIGYEALLSVTSQGEYNTALGHKAGRNVSSGEKMFFLVIKLEWQSVMVNLMY